MIIRIRTCILVFLNFLMLFPLAGFAQSRWMPGGSAYFSSQTIRTTQQRDVMREKLHLSIHQIANGNHAKSMAIRAFLYQYCGEQARKYMQGADIDGKGLKLYQQYTYLQTQLYQSLQPTVQKIRVIMGDKNISFPIILSHLQSNDSSLLYYYDTIPQRYTDTVFFADMEIVRDGLRRYKTANDQYPISLSDLIVYKFIPSHISLSAKKIIYRAYNLPEIILYTTLPPYKYTLIEPTYVLFYQAQYKSNIEYIESLDMLRRKIRTFDFATRHQIKNTPLQYNGKGVGWKLDIPETNN